MAHDLVIQLTVKDVANLVSQQSPTYTAKGLPWALRVMTKCSNRTNNEKKLGVYVKCNWESENEEWSCDQSATFTLMNRDTHASVSKSSGRMVISKFSSWGFHSFMSWNYVIDEQKGFLTDGAITIEVRITINKIIGIDKVTLKDFSKPNENTNNVVLVIDQKRLNVSKEFLSVHSSVFTALFFGGFSENEKEEIELKEIDYDQFVDFLNVIYPTSVEILSSTVGHILTLADRFQVEYVLNKAQAFLLTSKKIGQIRKLELADKFRLKRLMIQCLNRYNSADEVYKLRDTSEYASFSDATKGAICDRLMHLSRK